MNVWLPSIVSVLLVSVISLIGVVALALKDKVLHKTLMLLVSFSAGALLGDSFFHLLPEAVSSSGSFTLPVSIFVLSGILVFFILEKAILWRHCHYLGEEEECRVHGSKTFAKMNLIGDSIHNFLDGLVIGGSYLVNFGLGLATTLAVIFHEIPQEVGDFGVLVAGGYSKAKALLFNFFTALTAFAGAILAILISASFNFTAFLVPFTAGGFIYIAASDLIPELHKQTNRLGRILTELFFFVLGISVMLILLYVE